KVGPFKTASLATPKKKDPQQQALDDMIESLCNAFYKSILERSGDIVRVQKGYAASAGSVGSFGRVAPEFAPGTQQRKISSDPLVVLQQLLDSVSQSQSRAPTTPSFAPPPPPPPPVFRQRGPLVITRGQVQNPHLQAANAARRQTFNLNELRSQAERMSARRGGGDVVIPPRQNGPNPFQAVQLRPRGPQTPMQVHDTSNNELATIFAAMNRNRANVAVPGQATTQPSFVGMTPSQILAHMRDQNVANPAPRRNFRARPAVTAPATTQPATIVTPAVAAPAQVQVQPNAPVTPVAAQPQAQTGPLPVAPSVAPGATPPPPPPFNARLMAALGATDPHNQDAAQRASQSAQRGTLFSQLSQGNLMAGLRRTASQQTITPVAAPVPTPATTLAPVIDLDDDWETDADADADADTTERVNLNVFGQSFVNVLSGNTSTQGTPGARPVVDMDAERREHEAREAENAARQAAALQRAEQQRLERIAREEAERQEAAAAFRRADASSRAEHENNVAQVRNGTLPSRGNILLSVASFDLNTLRSAGARVLAPVAPTPPVQTPLDAERLEQARTQSHLQATLLGRRAAMGHDSDDEDEDDGDDDFDW
ncbi:MAG: hypothetical protein LCH26_00800, partial [Proteobacteria bacterium]|nr:hypothetical protein [Pseudomonadota bacterium]